MSKFTPAGSGGAPVEAAVSGVTDPTIQNVSLALAATEYVVSLPSGTRRFLLKLRQFAPTQLSYIAGQSGTDYVTIGSGAFYGESELEVAPTLYIQSPLAGVTAEVVSWT